MVEEHQRRGQDNEKRLRQSEIALQRRIEEEQEETLAVSKARDNAMADVKKHQNEVRQLEDELALQRQKYSSLLCTIDNINSSKVDELKEMEKNHALELERLQSTIHQLLEDKEHLKEQVINLEATRHKEDAAVLAQVL